MQFNTISVQLEVMWEDVHTFLGATYREVAGQTIYVWIGEDGRASGGVTYLGLIGSDTSMESVWIPIFWSGEESPAEVISKVLKAAADLPKPHAM